MDTTLQITQTHVCHKLLPALTASVSSETGLQAGPVSSERRVLTLQHQDLSHQHLWVHHLREQVHGGVHQVSAEDRQEFLPDHVPLLSAGSGLRGLGRLPLGALPRPTVDHVLVTRVGIGPVRLLLVFMDSAVLKIRRLAVGGGRAERVSTVSVVGRGAVHRPDVVVGAVKSAQSRRTV